jgi:hypothetical protein
MSVSYTVYLPWVGLAAFAVAVVAIFLLQGCSGDMARIRGKSDLAPSTPMGRDLERERSIGQGKDFCVKYPADIACKGPKQ